MDEVETDNDCYAIYTSPPPAAEPLLKEKPLERHFNRMNLSPIKTADKTFVLNNIQRGGF